MKTLGRVAAFCAVLGAAGCVEPPSSPAQAAARKAAAAEFVARRCGGMAGGFTDAQALRKVANEQAVLSRSLGATDGMMVQARRDVETAFNTAAAFTSHQDACGSMMGELAWVT
ncbi:MAG: hypothetical protein AAGF60_04460 [Pseudomonadota bacterium]